MFPIAEGISRGVDRLSSMPDHGLCDYVGAACVAMIPASVTACVASTIVRMTAHVAKSIGPTSILQNRLVYLNMMATKMAARVRTHGLG